MSEHMAPAKQALCYFYRNPPANSGVRPQPYKDIPELIQLPQTLVDTIKTVVKRFHLPRQARGRKPGRRKTTPAEDAKILACFQKVRRPLGSLVESRDVREEPSGCVCPQEARRRPPPSRVLGDNG